MARAKMTGRRGTALGGAAANSHSMDYYSADEWNTLERDKSLATLVMNGSTAVPSRHNRNVLPFDSKPYVICPTVRQGIRCLRA